MKFVSKQLIKSKAKILNLFLPVIVFDVCRTDGRVFDGQWRNGLQHGKGQYTNAQGKVRKGVWEDGRRLRQEEQ